jgi:ketosteroid isomerase-like protein
MKPFVMNINITCLPVADPFSRAGAMKGLIVLAVLLVATASCPVLGQNRERMPNKAAARQDSHSEQELLKLLRERRDAFYRGDIGTFSHLETNDFTRITERGRLVNKEEQLAGMKAQIAASGPGNAIPIYTDDDLKVRVYGDVAVITGRLTEKGKSASGESYNEQTRFTEVWVKRDGEWQTVHNHYTTIYRR